MPRPGPPATPSPRRTARRRARALGAAVAIGALVGAAAGCGPHTIAAEPPPTSTSAGPSPTTPDADPTPVATSPDDRYAAPADAYVRPVRPATLDGPPSEDAAIAFAEYYLRLYTYAYLTGDAAELNALGETGCVYCQGAAADIEREYRGGGHDEGGTISISSASAHDYGADGFYVATLAGTQAPVREVDANGAVVIAADNAADYLYQFALHWSATRGWALAELGVEDR